MQIPTPSQQSLIDKLAELAFNDSVHWTNDGRKVYYRPDAIKSLAQGAATKFVLHDDTWHQADWSKPGDLSRLLVQRAVSIRAKYDYVRVMYSGGVDSHAILTSFRAADIAPDEIVYMTCIDRHAAKYSNNFEIHRSVEAFLPVLRQWFPSCKFTKVDLDFDDLAAWSNVPMAANPFAVYSSGIRSMSMAMVLCFIDTGQANSITLTGADKPRLDFIQGAWYAYFLDCSSQMSFGRGIEGFFYGSDPDIHIAQCHAIKNLLQANNVVSRRDILSWQNSVDWDIRNKINLALLRPQPFDPVVIIGKRFARKSTQDVGDSAPKVYLLNRQLRTSTRGQSVLAGWQQCKDNFTRYTGMDHNTSVFGTFYNLTTGQAHTVDQLFPRGWQAD
jgi:hypothetical protein